MKTTTLPHGTLPELIAGLDGPAIHEADLHRDAVTRDAMDRRSAGRKVLDLDPVEHFTRGEVAHLETVNMLVFAPTPTSGNLNPVRMAYTPRIMMRPRFRGCAGVIPRRAGGAPLQLSRRSNPCGPKSGQIWEYACQ